MKQFKINYTGKAEADLDNILHYIGKDNPIKAIEFIDKLRSRIDSVIGSFPSSGIKTGKNRYTIFESYIIAYKVVEEEKVVYIKLISEGHRLWKNILASRC